MRTSRGGGGAGRATPLVPAVDSTTGLPIRTTLTNPRERREQPGGPWGYEPRPGSPPPSRDVLRFVQSLGLSTSVTNPRRDLQSGFVVAGILARFYPGDVRTASFQNGTSERVRRDNWDQILRLARRKGLAITDELAEGTMRGSSGSALSLLQLLYEASTGKKVQRMPDLSEASSLGLAATAALPALSFGEHAGDDAGALKAMRPAASSAGSGAAAATAPSFGVPQAQPSGDALALRRRFAAGM